MYVTAYRYGVAVSYYVPASRCRVEDKMCTTLVSLTLQLGAVVEYVAYELMATS